MPKIQITLTEQDIRTAVKQYLERQYEMTLPNESTLTIETKSKQNYRSEWENAEYRGKFESTL